MELGWIKPHNHYTLEPFLGPAVSWKPPISDHPYSFHLSIHKESYNSIFKIYLSIWKAKLARERQRDCIPDSLNGPSGCVRGQAKGTSQELYPGLPQGSRDLRTRAIRHCSFIHISRTESDVGQLWPELMPIWGFHTSASVGFTVPGGSFTGFAATLSWS